MVLLMTSTLNGNYLNESNNRLQQLQQTFYESNSRALSSSDSDLLETTTTSNANNPLTNSANNGNSAHNLTAIRLANEHFLLIRTQYRCRKPRPKIIKVKDFYDVPSKEYLPRCTVLHQCDDESGCCDVGTERCMAQTSESVRLYFYVIDADLKDNTTGGNGGRTEVLTFVNHTKCHCQEINYMPRTKPMPEHWQPEHQQQSPPEPQFKPAYSFESPVETPNPLQSDSDVLTLKCRCPHPFIARLNPMDGRCLCDCLEKDYHCIRIKKGRHKLAALEARCVRSGDCSEPMCDYGGHYSKYEAKCITPKHNHHLRHRHHNHQRHHKQVHWLHERD
ncbi:uncharacterized protein LOC128962518 [Oppia nitens]|uniref:uncharacterized protein LOC128962518 n=1 Tax=Oppia nitens TaxID=1686743 RepID=UPI0023DB0067|nr:uncharacterized protein LOC128962518 [Oppia nitens]